MPLVFTLLPFAAVLAAVGAQVSPVALRGGDDPITSVTYNEDTAVGTIKRIDVLREYEKAGQGNFDTIQVQFKSRPLHISVKDLHATLSYEEAMTKAFTLDGHLVHEYGSITYVVSCPACPEGGCEDAVCTFTDKDDEDDALEVAHEVFTETQEGAHVLAPHRELARKSCNRQSDCSLSPSQECIFYNWGGECQNCKPAGHAGCYCTDKNQHCKSSCDKCHSNRCEGCGCFSSESTVVIKGKGDTPIKDLRIGDMVLSDDRGTYSTFYSKGHYNEHTSTEFLRITTEVTKHPLEATPGHMVFKASGTLPVPASSIKVGDVVKTVHGPSKVVSVKKITRNGLFNPITLSGSLVVDGIVASAHSEERGFEGGEAGWLYLGGYKVIHWHRLMHSIHAPHRIICGRLVTCAETPDDDGLPPFHQFLVALQHAAMEKNSVIFSAFVLLAVIIFTIPFYVIELLLENMSVMLPGICLMMWVCRVLSDVKVKVKSA